jgi:hypothetical protein
MLQALEHEVHDDSMTVRSASEIFFRLTAIATRRRGLGPFYDRSFALARDKAVVWSTLRDLIAFYIDTANEPHEAAQLADAFGSPVSDGHREFILWASHVAHARAGTLLPEVLLQDLGSPTSLGPVVWTHTCDALARHISRMDPHTREAFERLGRRLDTRPSHRAHLAVRAGEMTRDLPLVASLCDSLLHAQQHSDMSAWCLARRGEQTALLAMASSLTLPTTRRAYALDLYTASP